MIPTILAAALAGATLIGSAGVIDGDTIRLEGQRVRIWGVNAPESHTPEGPAATRAMAQLIRGKTVECRLPPSGQDHDKYRRLVRQCWAGGVDLGAEMVRTGHAVDWARYSGGFYAGVGR